MFNNGRYVLRFVKASLLVKTCNLHKISCGTLKYLKYCYEHGEIQLSILLIMYVIFEVLAFSWLVCYRSWNWYLQWISYYTIIEYIYIINIIWSLRNLFLFTLIILIQFMNNCSLLGMQNIYKKKHKSHSYDSNYYAKIFSIKIYWNYEILYILWEKFYLKIKYCA